MSKPIERPIVRPIVRPCGEDAVVLEYGEVIDPAIGRRVAAAAHAIEAADPPGLREVVPTFRSVLVLFDPDVTDPDTLVALAEGAGEAGGEGARRWRLPVCLTGAMAEDISQAAEGLSLSEDEVRQRLLASEMQVGMFGFAPGFAYLSGVDPALAIPRRPAPRPPMPVGSLIIAGGMAALTSMSMPTGWYVVGRTAISLFRPERQPMVPFAVGDTIRLSAVGPDELDALTADPDGGATMEGA